MKRSSKCKVNQLKNMKKGRFPRSDYKRTDILSIYLKITNSIYKYLYTV